MGSIPGLITFETILYYFLFTYTTTEFTGKPNSFVFSGSYVRLQVH